MRRDTRRRALRYFRRRQTVPVPRSYFASFSQSHARRNTRNPWPSGEVLNDLAHKAALLRRRRPWRTAALRTSPPPARPVPILPRATGPDRDRAPPKPRCCRGKGMPASLSDVRPLETDPAGQSGRAVLTRPVCSIELPDEIPTCVLVSQRLSATGTATRGEADAVIAPLLPLGRPTKLARPRRHPKGATRGGMAGFAHREREKGDARPVHAVGRDEEIRFPHGSCSHPGSGVFSPLGVPARRRSLRLAARSTFPARFRATLIAPRGRPIAGPGAVGTGGDRADPRQRFARLAMGQ